MYNCLVAAGLSQFTTVLQFGDFVDWATWRIEFPGNGGPLVPLTINTALLTGGSTVPTITQTNERNGLNDNFYHTIPFDLLYIPSKLKQSS